MTNRRGCGNRAWDTEDIRAFLDEIDRDGSGVIVKVRGYVRVGSRGGGEGGGEAATFEIEMREG